MITSILAPAYSDEAGKYAMEVDQLKKFRTDLGEAHPDTLRAKNNLGVTLQARGELARARELLEVALQESRRVLGKHHADTLVAMSNLAFALCEGDEPERALALQKKVLKWRRRTLGAEHMDTLAAMDDLACIRLTQGDTSGALSLQEAVLKIKLRNLGKDHPDTLDAAERLACTINNQAVDLRNSGNLDEAERLQMKALEMMTALFGSRSLDAAFAYSATGALMKCKGEISRAMDYFRMAIEIRERELGTDAELTQLVRRRLHEILH